MKKFLILLIIIHLTGIIFADDIIESIYLNFEAIKDFKIIAETKIVNSMANNTSERITKTIYYASGDNKARIDKILPIPETKASYINNKFYLEQNGKVISQNMPQPLNKDLYYPEPIILFELRKFLKNFVLKNNSDNIYIFCPKNSKSEYPQIQLKIDSGLLIEIDFYNNAGNLYQKIILMDYIEENKIKFPAKVIIEIITKKNILKKEINYKNIEINRGINEEIFILQ